MCKRIVVFGITGSIGTNTAKIIKAFPERFRLIGCSAGGNESKLSEMMKDFPDARQVVADRDGFEKVIALLDLAPDMIVMAMPGKSGWKIVIEAIQRGIPVALANKESLVIAGYFLGREVTADRRKIIPVDSEHAALLQLFDKINLKTVKKAWITASGGALYKMSKEEMLGADAEQALKHPVWDMGSKVTVDSATMVNKGLELIEAYWLFPVEPGQLGVIVHPEVAMHAVVEFVDGTAVGQFGASDMTIPIASAMAYPEMLKLTDKFPELATAFFGRSYNFYDADTDKYPMLGLAFELLGGMDYSGMVAYAIADEIAVESFLKGKIRISGIHDIVQKTVAKFRNMPKPSDIAAIDRLILEIEEYALNINRGG